METCTPDIGEPTIINPEYVPPVPGYFTTEENPDYVPAVPAHEEVIANPDYIPAVPGYYTEVPNPDYVPGTEGYYTPAEKLWKWVWTGGPVNQAPESPIVNPRGWNEVGWSNDGKGRNNPDTVIQTGNPGKANYFYYQTIQVWHEGTPAIGEPTILVWTPEVPAVGEPTITVYHEAIPEVGEPTIEVWHPAVPAQGNPTIDNPDYVPGECTTIPDPSTPAQPVTYTAQAVVPATTQTDTLPNTGSNDPISGLVFAGVDAAAGAALMIRRVARR